MCLRDISLPSPSGITNGTTLCRLCGVGLSTRSPDLNRYNHAPVQSSAARWDWPLSCCQVRRGPQHSRTRPIRDPHTRWLALPVSAQISSQTTIAPRWNTDGLNSRSAAAYRRQASTSLDAWIVIHLLHVKRDLLLFNPVPFVRNGSMPRDYPWLVPHEVSEAIVAVYLKYVLHLARSAMGTSSAPLWRCLRSCHQQIVRSASDWPLGIGIVLEDPNGSTSTPPLWQLMSPLITEENLPHRWWKPKRIECKASHLKIQSSELMHITEEKTSTEKSLASGSADTSSIPVKITHENLKMCKASPFHICTK